MKRVLVPSESPWGGVMGYSRAVRSGPFVAVAGTVAANADGSAYAPGDAYAQAQRILEVIVAALAAAGASPDDVVRTRIFTTGIAHFEAIGRAHAEVFGRVRPACTMVEVAALVHPDFVVEIEADAVIAGD